MVKIIEGNLLNAEEDIIAHQVNCCGVMGSGVALQIKTLYPSVYAKYKEQVTPLGKLCLGTIQVCQAGNKKVVNMFGQEFYGVRQQQTDYHELESCLLKLKMYAKPRNLSVALPYKVGCGRGGGDWEYVLSKIIKVFDDYEVTLYKYGE